MEALTKVGAIFKPFTIICGGLLYCIRIGGMRMPTQNEGGGTSMFETVKDHEERIQTLEDNDKRHEEQLSAIKSNHTNLENTILKSNQSQQDFFRDTMSKQWELIKARDNSKEAESKRVHELNLSTHALKKSNSERAWEFVGKLIMAGGIIYLIVEKLLLSIGGN